MSRRGRRLKVRVLTEEERDDLINAACEAEDTIPYEELERHTQEQSQ